MEAINAIMNMENDDARSIALEKLKKFNGTMNSAFPEMMLSTKSRNDYIKRICMI